MGRKMGGLPYARRHKEHFSPVVELIGGAAWSAADPTRHSAIINAAGQAAAMIILLPSTALSHGRLRIYFYNLDLVTVPPFLMNFSLYIGNYNCGVDPAGPQATRQVLFDGATGLSCYEESMDVLVGAANVPVGDVVLIEVYYAAAGGGGEVTNFEVMGSALVEA